MSVLFTLLGDAGMVCFLSAYFLLQQKRLASDGYPYLLLNLAGSVLLMLSLSHDWNLPAFLLEAAWCAISLYGICKLGIKGRASR